MDHTTLTDPPASAPGSGPTPVAATERIASIDVLRGVALLGILVMNIPFFALSYYGFMRPQVLGGFEGIDYAAWLGSHLFFDMKMMSIFSMLFGAGLMLMADRADQRGTSAAGVYYRRLGWLALIGLAHAYFLWYGDILFSYAVCGLVLYPARRLPTAALLAIGVALITLGILISVAFGGLFAFLRDAQPAEWDKVYVQFNPTEQMLADERAAMLGSYAQYAPHNIGHALEMHLKMMPMFGVWRVAGLMFLGMAFYKSGFLTGGRTRGTYLGATLAGFGLGVPLVWIGASRLVRTDFDPVDLFLLNWHFNGVGSVLVAVGWIGLVHLLLQIGVPRFISGSLGAVGRMALSNYLMQTLICTTLFCGWGFGLWGSLSRFELLGVVAAVWAVQLVASPIWLSRLRFGPAEWAWRSLTYWKLQPMRRAA